MTAMTALNMTKIAFGCDGFDELRARLAARIERGENIVLSTRYLPKRVEEMTGGSLYWISQHRFGLRQPLVGFSELEGGRIGIVLAPVLIEVEPRPRRAHQGWRYLSAEDAPKDLPQDGASGEGIPAALHAELAAMGLL
ncbi:DUF1489 family protein [Rhizorhabdus dicambivorans]|uniref:DUF1489 domain-containing protein n=1 Tax=Rhizorhabdus dicambivorans TaxID=1850238 RepID=A0A2A4G1Y7_9SPHN|nr:DUF1489 domain-containing protein [Rhizorhabdus dicambivorans]ATE66716.1 hypothetical protein CMV14_21765 [Rhizorhabdus dicambivorans]PCE43797.1 hypothetical protein COO09_02380 [Rhizorhabdus dicambivorans]